MSLGRTWRTAVAAVAGLLAVGMTGACGSESSNSGSSAPAESSRATPSDSAFPVTMEHKFGSTTIESRPTRVAVIGYTDADAVFALGTNPVLVRIRESYGPKNGIWPWVEPYATATPAPVATDLGSEGIDAEQVAAVKPDLIIGISAGITQSNYDTLSAIAPVVAVRADYADYGQPWQEVTEDIGIALGEAEKARELIETVNAKVEGIRADHPNWAGQSATVAMFDGTQVIAFTGGDQRARFFADLGFVAPAALEELSGDEIFTEISLENANVLDHDVIVWDQLTYAPNGRAGIEATPALAGLVASRENRVVYLEPERLEFAFGWQTVLSIPEALDGIVPLLEQAIPND